MVQGGKGGEGGLAVMPSHWQAPPRLHGHHGCPVAHGAQESSVTPEPGTAEHESHAEVQGGKGGGEGGLAVMPSHWQAPPRLHGHHACPVAHGAQESSVTPDSLPFTRIFFSPP